eukprot:CAMPEP_0179011200 /NCGR_PEP_ID=MMETSP0796-20121207/538_1 /TAXON_ID=73915 /ORGANISM="Pyrodinium bahamense, Strain pbaha01" /LENGTH=229 /DNA_ID=CAMNT_0020706565 /DNA_START=64 /DNA_END=751 /DNA_ORIENTATION=+
MSRRSQPLAPPAGSPCVAGARPLALGRGSSCGFQIAAAACLDEVALARIRLLHAEVQHRGPKAAQGLRDPCELAGAVHAKKVQVPGPRFLLLPVRPRIDIRAEADCVDLQWALCPQELHHLFHPALRQNDLGVQRAAEVLRALAPLQVRRREAGAEGTDREVRVVDGVVVTAGHLHKRAAGVLDVRPRRLHDAGDAAPDLAATGNVDLAREGEDCAPHLAILSSSGPVA